MTAVARASGVVAVCCVMTVFLLAQGSRTRGVIEWSSDRKLTRGDFKAAVPSRSTESSRSWVMIDASWECHDGVGTSDARAVFDPERSWWKDPSPNLWTGVGGAAPVRNESDSERALLSHEQLHFDLTELWTRKVRLALADLPAACKTREGIKRMEATLSALQREWQDEQDKYDRETDRGTDARRQAAWETKTRKTLEEDYPSAAR